LRILDLLLLPFVLVAGIVMKLVRRAGFQRLPWCRRLVLRLGVLPIRNHYYEPFPHPGNLRRSLADERELPGIDWNIGEQITLLQDLHYEGELSDLRAPKRQALDFRLDNGSFESGDAEYLYQTIRARKPRRIYEIGSGNSTLIARRAIAANVAESPGHACKHLCIEPYEAPWLESAGVTVLRQRVEDVDRALFLELEANDLLFIDSSHVIRPQGDVVTEYLQILPSLRPGVIVHVHDIFSPRDYPADWLVERLWLWNEQYLVEALLTESRSWKVIGALNLLKHRHFAALRRVCPFLTPDREPGSLYLQKFA